MSVSNNSNYGNSLAYVDCDINMFLCHISILTVKKSTFFCSFILFAGTVTESLLEYNIFLSCHAKCIER